MQTLQRTEDKPDVDLDSFVRTHQSMVRRYLRLLGADPSEADDLMQETFLRVPLGESGECRVETPAAFLRAVARNLLLGARRTARRRAPTVEWSKAVDELVASDPDLLEDEHVQSLRACIAKLADRARRAVELHHLEGRTYREVAATLGLRINGLRTLLSRARRLLRDCLIQESNL